MLTGQDLGLAIATAIQLKLDSGKVRSRAEIARYFEVQPPALSTWVKHGRIAKDKLPKLFEYFSDVVPPSHWGLSEAQANTFQDRAANSNHIQTVVDLMRTLPPEEQAMICGIVVGAASTLPSRKKANQRKIT